MKCRFPVRFRCAIILCFNSVECLVCKVTRFVLFYKFLLVFNFYPHCVPVGTGAAGKSSAWLPTLQPCRDGDFVFQKKLISVKYFTADMATHVALPPGRRHPNNFNNSNNSTISTIKTIIEHQGRLSLPPRFPQLRRRHLKTSQPPTSALSESLLPRCAKPASRCRRGCFWPIKLFPRFAKQGVATAGGRRCRAG